MRERRQTLKSFMDEHFGDQVAVCPHCNEYRLKHCVCLHCRLDPDSPIVTHIVTSHDGVEWEVALFDKDGRVVEDIYCETKKEAVSIAGREAIIRNPRPQTYLVNFNET